MPDRLSVDVVIVVNEEGEYIVAANAADASDRAEAGLDQDSGQRFVTLRLTLQPPSRAAEAVQTFTFQLD